MKINFNNIEINVHIDLAKVFLTNIHHFNLDKIITLITNCILLNSAARIQRSALLALKA